MGRITPAVTCTSLQLEGHTCCLFSRLLAIVCCDNFCSALHLTQIRFEGNTTPFYTLHRLCKREGAAWKSLFERGPPVLGDFELSTPNLVHWWSSMSVIRWCMPFGDGVHSARAMHMHCVFAQAPSPSGNFELATRNLVHWYRSTSAIRWYMTWGVMVQCARATSVQYANPLISGNFDLAMWKLGQWLSSMTAIRQWTTQDGGVHRPRAHVQLSRPPSSWKKAHYWTKT